MPRTTHGTHGTGTKAQGAAVPQAPRPEEAVVPPALHTAPGLEIEAPLFLPPACRGWVRSDTNRRILELEIEAALCIPPACGWVRSDTNRRIQFLWS